MEPQRSITTPVALFIFNRPTLTTRVLEAIARARPPQLLVVGDGPRPDRHEDAALVAETRALLDRVDWPCEVLTYYAAENMGCKNRLASGLDWVFSKVPEAILVEDDCLPDPTFFPYCAELLVRFRDEPQVHMVSGSNTLAPGRLTEDSYYFSRCYHIWGWATWARAWSHYDLEMRAWPAVRDSGWLERLLGGEVPARIAREIFDLTHAGQVPTWDFQWVFSSWLAGGVSITPSVNLVTNLGYGPLAAHERNAEHPLANRPTEQIAFPLQHPTSITVLESADDLEWRTFYPRYYEVAQGGPRRRLPRLSDQLRRARTDRRSSQAPKR